MANAVTSGARRLAARRLQNPKKAVVALSRQDLGVIDAVLDRDGAMDISTISQGRLGDCFFLATLIGMMNTDNGANLIRRNVRKLHSESGNRIGYEIRYPGRNLGRWERVTDVYVHGAKDNGAVGLVSVMERAYGRGFMWRNIDCSGRAEWASWDLTRRLARLVVNRDYLVWTTDQFDASERQVIVDGIRAWNAVVAQTSTARRRHFREYAIDRDTGVKTGKGYGRARVNLRTQDGPEAHISILRAHDYTVLDADLDAGLLLRNPFGTNFDLDRHLMVDAAFWMSWDDAERYIGDIVVSRGFSDQVASVSRRASSP